MKTYLYTGSGRLFNVDCDSDNKVDIVNNKIDLLDNVYGLIDWMWLIPEDGIFTANGEKIKVVKDDILLCLYSYNKTGGRESRTFCVVKNEEWVNHIKARIEYEKEANKCCDSDCEKCCCEPA